MMGRFPSSLLAILLFMTCSVMGEDTPQGKRSPRRALPSVSADHYSEVLSDGTYKYAYTGEHRYVAERRLSDGTVEGESLYIRPDGVPVKVHYFADKEGYRPKTEVLYKERLGVVTTRVAPSRETVVVPHVREIVRTVPVPVPAHGPPVVLAPPRNGENSVNVNLGDLFRNVGGHSDDTVIANPNGGDVAVASPSVTAIVGPGGRAIVRPEAVARTSGTSKYFRSGGGGGDVAIASPKTTAIVGAGGSVIVEPRAAAYTGSSGGPEVITREIHHTRNVAVPVPVPVPAPEPAIHAVRSSSGYSYEAPSRHVAVVQPQPVFVAQQPPPTVVSRGVVLVPPRSSYSYSYGYNAPDSKHPQRDNSAYVNVQVNQ